MLKEFASLQKWQLLCKIPKNSGSAFSELNIISKGFIASSVATCVLLLSLIVQVLKKPARPVWPDNSASQEMNTETADRGASCH